MGGREVCFRHKGGWVIFAKRVSLKNIVLYYSLGQAVKYTSTLVRRLNFAGSTVQLFRVVILLISFVKRNAWSK